MAYEHTFAAILVVFRVPIPTAHIWEPLLSHIICLALIEGQAGLLLCAVVEVVRLGPDKVVHYVMNLLFCQILVPIRNFISQFLELQQY